MIHDLFLIISRSEMARTQPSGPQPFTHRPLGPTGALGGCPTGAPADLPGASQGITGFWIIPSSNPCITGLYLVITGLELV